MNLCDKNVGLMNIKSLIGGGLVKIKREKVMIGENYPMIPF